MSYNDCEAAVFDRKVLKSLQNVRAVLDNTRNPQLPKDVAHAYENKYTLAESAVKSSFAGVLQTLELVCGLDIETLAALKKWSKTQTVTLQFSATEKCEFLRTTERKEESATQHVHERTGFLAGTSTSKTVTRITEHFWKFVVDWSVTAFAGTGAEESMTLLSRTGRCELMTVGKDKHAPAPEVSIRPGIKVDVSFLLANLTAEGSVDFSINRAQATCHTPRRNEQTDSAIEFEARLRLFTAGVLAYFGTLTGKEKNLNPIPSEDIFSPVLAMFVFEGGGESPTLSDMDFNKFLLEHRRQLSNHREAIAKVFPASEEQDKLNTVAEIALRFGLKECEKLSLECVQALNTVEGMLREQVVAAIGKEVGPSDLTSYMEYHCRQLLKPEFQPKGFCYAVRRPDHSPEGTLSIEYDRGTASEKDGQALIRTVVHSSGECEPALTGGSGAAPVQTMKFALDAATTVSFTGERHLHACVLHEFSGRGGGSAVPLRLLARARQFSSFVLLVGKIASADLFEPTAALIVQNKDDLEIPLMLETMPTPKEFKDAIESLSPEQQRFCKAFRSMQLASTLFGVCVVQIKPQLERLLNLPPDSLTKEIQLTNDLMELFTKYQIPSDLISYAGDSDASQHAKLVGVKEHVAALMTTIAKAKEKELADERQEAAKANAYQPVRSRRGSGQRSLPPSLPQMEYGMVQASSSVFMAPPMAPPPQNIPAPPPQCLSVESFSAPPPVAKAKMSMASSSARQGDGAGPPTAATPLQSTEGKMSAVGSGGSAMGTNAVDYTRIPAVLDARCETLDRDSALRPTTIKTGKTWGLKFQRGLLSKPEMRSLHSGGQDEEKAKAFDLLDALSRSGVLPIEAASLHVILAATHCFDQTMMDTIVQGNVNPIEPVERSLLIVAGVVHGKDTRDMIQPSQFERISQFAPHLLENEHGSGISGQ